jgi:hypothetical protein
MGRLKTGWSLVKKSWAVVREHPGMAWLPIMGGILALISLIIFGTPAAILAGGTEPTNAEYAGAIILGLVAMYLASFFIIYFNVALAGAADAAFRNEPVTIGGSLAVAKSKLGVIAAWALVAGIVSLLFAVLRDRGGIGGQIVAALGGALWSLITFLVIPVLAFEDIGPIAAIKRSAGLFKQKWGEQIGGNAAIGLITVLIVLLAVGVGALGVLAVSAGTMIAQVAGACIIAGAVVLLMAAMIVSSVARGVFGVALYHYVADTGQTGPFTAAELNSAVKQKKTK